MIKKLWDELVILECLTSCTCSVAKEYVDVTNTNKLMQFLMRLDENFEQVRNQILLLDPFPFINKVYSMVLKFETQKVVSSFTENVGSVALLTKGQGPKNTKKKPDHKKEYYNHYNMDGHMKDNYFKLIGYPD